MKTENIEQATQEMQTILKLLGVQYIKSIYDLGVVGGEFPEENVKNFINNLIK